MLVRNRNVSLVYKNKKKHLITLGSSNQSHILGNHSDVLEFNTGSLLSTEAQEEKSTIERITESCFKVMESKIDELEEKNHNVFNHKSSIKLDLCLRRKGRL